MRALVLCLVLSGCSTFDPKLSKCELNDVRTRMEMIYPDGEKVSAVICLGVVGPPRIYTR